MVVLAALGVNSWTTRTDSSAPQSDPDPELAECLMAMPVSDNDDKVFNTTVFMQTKTRSDAPAAMPCLMGSAMHTMKNEINEKERRSCGDAAPDGQHDVLMKNTNVILLDF